MTRLIISGNRKYLTWLQSHLAKEHRKTKNRTKLRK